jgi:hypothetical protein
MTTTNGCPICAGLGRVLAFGVTHEPVAIACPECAGLAITPASADDRAMRSYSAREILDLLLRHPALPAPTELEAGAG